MPHVARSPDGHDGSGRVHGTCVARYSIRRRLIVDEADTL